MALHRVADTAAIGIGGPVGSGKTRLIERLLPELDRAGLTAAVVTNDLLTTEDAERVERSGLIPSHLVVGVETGACPHTAIREDPSINLEAISQLQRRHGPLDVILVESGGDNLAATFTADLVDCWVFVIDVAAGEDIPRKRGLGVVQADLVVVNKTDLAPHVGADLDRMADDLSQVRGRRPWEFTDLGPEGSARAVFDRLREEVLFDRLPGG